ncbi:MAG: ribosomal RNA small subunit methyltransferase A [Lentisphaeria bacterium]|nr:ribosomal RNA small subunit methyltransferase A [Lentisphaeria bacterium]
MNKKELVAELEKLGMRPGRGLGQNFLLDGNLLDWIVRASGVTAGERILEVGPGFGALTSRLLAAGAELTAIEYDHRLADYNREKFAACSNFHLVEADACRVDYDELFPAGTVYRSVANLPYAISSVFIAKLLECANQPKSMFFMLQKEMGERLAARSGTKAYGALSVRVQLDYEVKIEKIVPPEVFCPPPEVESALVSFTLREEKLCRDDEKKLVSRVVRTAFNQRRKQLGKVLGQMFGKAEVEAVFAKLDLPMEIRPDKLEVADFVAIARELNLIAGDSDNE